LWFYRTAIPATISRRLQIGVALAGAAILLLGLETIQLRLASLAVDWEKLVQHGDFQSSLGYRAGLWDIGLDRIAAHPLMGSGPQSTRGIISAGFADRYDLEVGFSHFHNGLLTAWVETGIAGAAALLALVAIVIRNALCTLRREASVNERFGAVLLLATVSTYSLHGATGLFIGHDILDSVLVALLTVGSFLSSGRPVDGRETADIHPAASVVTVSPKM
jgi:O-antigen ligase